MSYLSIFPRQLTETNLVSESPLVEGIVGQGGRVPLDVLDLFGPHEDGALFQAHAAVALGHLLDLGKGDLVYEGCAVAVAAIGLERGLLVGHCR